MGLQMLAGARLCTHTHTLSLRFAACCNHDTPIFVRRANHVCVYVVGETSAEDDPHQTSPKLHSSFVDYKHFGELCNMLFFFKFMIIKLHHNYINANPYGNVFEINLIIL